MFDIVWNSMRLLSLALGGLVVEFASVQTVYFSSGILLIGAGLLGLGLLRGYVFLEIKQKTDQL